MGESKAGRQVGVHCRMWFIRGCDVAQSLEDVTSNVEVRSVRPGQGHSTTGNHLRRVVI